MALTAFSLNIVIIKIVKDENIDDTDEYLNIRVTTTQTKINSKPKL